jgi:hypothetical protein
MGEVYRARDTRLDRTVAVKVLPSHVASDPALRQRFEREARAISSLDHPHIPGFPEELKRRVYTARLDQTGADLAVSLSGADFPYGGFAGCGHDDG